MVVLLLCSCLLKLFFTVVVRFEYLILGFRGDHFFSLCEDS
jgi:hypothetical protein